MGYPLFDVIHILSVVITLLFVLCGLKAFLQLGFRNRKKVLKAIPVVMFLMEIFKDCFLIRVHRFGLGFLPLHICSIGIFIWHGLLILYPLLLRTSGEIKPSIRHIYRPVLFLLVITPFIYIFDKRFGCNYFFVNTPPAGTSLQWIASVSGIPGYLAGYSVLVIAVFCIVYFMDRIAVGLLSSRNDL